MNKIIQTNTINSFFFILDHREEIKQNDNSPKQ